MRNVSRRFGEVDALRDLSLALIPGQVTCLLGPSGCGKSTSLRIAAGIETQDGGEIWVDGHRISTPGNHMRAQDRPIGMMFQDFALFPHMTVAANIRFGLKAGDKARVVAQMLERVSLSGFENVMPHELSGGEQQRVALARALVQKPCVMLLDEPFSGLDDRLRDGVRDATLALLNEENTATIFVTHDPQEAMRAADEIVLMRDGAVVQSGAPYTLFNAPQDQQAAAFFSDINKLPSVVNGGLAATPFGDVFVPGVADGRAVDIVLRPQHLRIDFDRAGRGPSPTAAFGQAARGTVRRSRFLGQHSLVDFTLDDGGVVTASVPSVFLPKPGMGFWLMAPRKHILVFER